ncbi:MAG: hypothetical protein KDC12_12715 [Flavobacteriales bacterium]|nr:hypothetical protein [Flavobacteriales bacterium]
MDQPEAPKFPLPSVDEIVQRKLSGEEYTKIRKELEEGAHIDRAIP